MCVHLFIAQNVYACNVFEVARKGGRGGGSGGGEGGGGRGGEMNWYIIT